MEDKETRKNLIDRIIAEKQKELNRFRNMEAGIQADIASFEKQKLDVDVEMSKIP